MIAKLQKKYAKSRVKTIRKFAPDLTGTSRNYAESNNRIIEIKSLLRMALDDTDMFILDTLDDLAAEAEENEDAPDRQEYPAELEREPDPRLRLKKWNQITRNIRLQAATDQVITRMNLPLPLRPALFRPGIFTFNPGAARPFLPGPGPGH